MTKQFLIGVVTLTIFPVSVIEAEDVLSVESFENTRGWSMVERGELSEVNEKVFKLSKGGKLLSNGAKKNKAQYIHTKKKWGDQEIRAEYMIPMNSNSGFYVQGRYEVQVFDSHAKQQVKFSDMGGLYQRWDETRRKAKLSPGFEGVAPMVNAALPHGEWQSLIIKFRAPRFDKSGYKLSHAHFVEVVLNGQVVQKGVNIKGPTRAAPNVGEVTHAPLVIQGNHGPILLRKLEVFERDYSEVKLAKLPQEESLPLDKSNRPQVDSVVLGKDAFTKRGCIECHSPYADDKAIKTGPGLYGVFQKRSISKNVYDGGAKENVMVKADEKYFLSSIAAPQKHLTLQTHETEKGNPYLPLMPPYTKEMIPETEVKAIYHYLLTLNKAENAGPASVFTSTAKNPRSASSLNTVPRSDRALVYRAPVSNGSSARAIHVGQVNGQNYTFDPRNMSISSIWTGGFLDMTSETDGRGGRASKIGPNVKAWPKKFTAILQPVHTDTMVGYDGGLTNSVTPDTFKRSVSFYDQLKARRGRLVGYELSEGNPTITYELDGSTVKLNFHIETSGKFHAVLSGDLKQDLVLKFPVDILKNVAVTGGELDVTKGTWRLSSLDEVASWSAVPANGLKGSDDIKEAREQQSRFVWADETGALDMIPGFSVQSANGPEYKNGVSPLFEPTAIDFEQDGTPVIGSRAAGIWKVKDGKWVPFALGTYEVLGLKVKKDGGLIVCQKPELSLIKDSDGDGRADVFQTLSADYRFTGNYHAYNHGPAVDSSGNIHFTLNLQHPRGVQEKEASYRAGGNMGTQGGLRGWNCRVDKEGRFSPYASGFRSAAGLAFSPDDELYASDNQGEYMGTSRINRVREGAFYGHPGGLIDLENMSSEALELGKKNDYITQRERSSILLPHKLVANSPGHPVWDTTEGAFGPFQGQMFIGDQTLSNIHRVHLETVNGLEQGAIMPFAQGLLSGPMRLAFSPSGEMWVGQTGRGWASRGNNLSALQKFKWNGKLEQAIHHVGVTSEGFMVKFTLPVAESERASYSAAMIDSWYYRDSKNYGSPELGKRVEDTVVAKWDKAGTAVFYKVENFGADPAREADKQATARVYRINLSQTAFGKINSLFLSTAYYTLNAVPQKNHAK